MVHPHVCLKWTLPLDSWCDLQKSTLTNHVHFYLGCVLRMHAGPLLPTQTYPWRSSRVCILNILGAAILIRFAIEMSQCELLLLIMRIFPAVVSCLLNPNLLSFALVIAHLSFSPPAYCPSICCFTNHFSFEITSMAPHWQFFSTAWNYLRGDCIAMIFTKS